LQTIGVFLSPVDFVRTFLIDHSTGFRQLQAVAGSAGAYVVEPESPCRFLVINPHVMRNAAWMLVRFASFQKPCIPADVTGVSRDQHKPRKFCRTLADLIVPNPG